jgi:hypothetical protein
MLMTMIDPIYAVLHTNAFLPAAAWYLPFYLYFVFALRAQKRNTKEDEVPLLICFRFFAGERKNENKRRKVPLRITTLGYRISRVIERGML